MVTILIVYFIFSQSITAENFSNFFHNNRTVILISYIAFALVRALFFIPSTVILILGIALFHDQFLLLLIINIIGILVGSSLMYLAGKFFTSEEFFSAKHQEKLPKIKTKINENGFLIVLLWSFFPLVPTDLICYVSGATHMKYLKFILALFIGELALVTIYLKTGKGLIELLF